MTVTDALMLMAVFQLKHFIADYLLQFKYMYQGKGANTGWFLPLFSHASVHGVLTGYIVYMFAPEVAFFAMVVDLASHMVIDRWKATREADISESKFWYYLGADQALHHYVSIFIIFVMYGALV